MRPGEKLYEELLKADEIEEQQVYPKIYVGKTAELYMDEIKEMIAMYATLDKESLRERLLDIGNSNIIRLSQTLSSVG